VLPILVVVYLVIWAWTRAHFMADTSVYAQAILNHQHGRGVLDYHQPIANPFWDFGHVLWRPVGWLCFVITKPVAQLLAQQNERTEVILTLIVINFVSALTCVVLFFLLARRILGGTIWPAALATIGLFSADAFLNYSHSGNAYVVGLACLVAGMYFIFGANERAPGVGSDLTAALMLALAVLFWFPYVFVLPAALAASYFCCGFSRWRLRSTGVTLVACAALGLTVYASTVAHLGIRSLAELRSWVMTSGHGQNQLGGVRAVARLAFSVPRSFINMDRDGMWLKRYLIHDPYAPVTTRDLFRLSLWKLVIFYGATSIVCIELLRSSRGRMLFLLLVSAVVPILFFALFIFEAGSIERYLPLYPFIFLACGYVLGAEHVKRVSKLLLVLALIATATVNVNAMRRGKLESEKAAMIARIHELIPLLGANDLVLAINEQDNLAQFRQNFPLDPINRDVKWRSYDVLEINTARLSTWRSDFAERALATWQIGGEVWLPKRVFSSRPNPDWNWVEGDDPRVKWTDLPSFFSRLETGKEVGGEDGFVLVQNSPRNKQILATAFMPTGSGEKEISQKIPGAIVPAASKCDAPTYPCARTDTSVIPLGTLPNWGRLTGANTVFIDKTFNPLYPPKYVRVTDGNSAKGFGAPHSGFAVGSGSGDDSHFNADDTLFWITDSGNSLYVYGLNPDTMSTGMVWVPNLLGAAAFSQTDRGYMYEVAADGRIHRYDLSSCVIGSCRPPAPKLIYDFVANCNVNSSIVFSANAGVGGSDSVFAAAYSARQQDLGHEVVAYDTSNKTCYFYNTQYGTVRSYAGEQIPTRGTVRCNGTVTIAWNSGSMFDTSWVGINFTIDRLTYVVKSVASPTSLTISSPCPAGERGYATEPGTLLGTVASPDRYSVHHARLDPSGKWLIIEEGSYCYSARCVIVHAWQVGTTTVKNCVNSCGSHYTTTASGWFNSIEKDGDSKAPPNPLLFRTWADFDSSNPTYIKYLNDTSSNVAIYRPFGNHPSAKNDSLGIHRYPIFTTTYAPESPVGTITSWVSDEVIAWPQTRPGPVMRFGHTFNSALAPPSCCFTARYAIGAASSTGRFYIFTSDGEGTLGSTTGGTTCSIMAGTCREDVFILNLAPPPAL
jgi:hypothetical protein